jgi:hypothetical protein
MIADQREYQITKDEVERFEEALAALDTNGNDRSSEMQELLRKALEGQLEDLRRELLEYESVLQARQIR